MRSSISWSSGLDTAPARTVHGVAVSARVSAGALSAALLVLGCAACTTTAKPAAGRSAAASVPAVTATATPSATTTPTETKPAKLTADTKVRRELLATFIAFRSSGTNAPGYAAIPPSAVAGISPRTLDYAYDPATGTYWAVASFSATTAASQTDAFVGFQDGGNTAVFMRPSGASWQVRSVGPCMAGLPGRVEAAMKLAASPYPGC